LASAAGEHLGVIISVINMSGGAISDADLQCAIRAVNRQIKEDFEPHWGFGACLRLEGKTAKKARGFDPADMRGDAVLYLHDVARIRAAEGFHDKNFSGIPFGFVFLELSDKLKEAWTTTLSHEALELLADPEANLLVQGPHPKQPKRRVFHWFEMCDAVQDETYLLDGIRVSNFILPLYFTSSEERGGRNDFLGTVADGKTLRSFSTNPGGYIGFFDPTLGKNGDDDTFEHDKRALERLKAKERLRAGRGQMRRRQRELQ
jgi:hypothetical protein